MVACAVGFGIFMIWFFRDPKRDIIINPKKFYAPADGTVIEVETVNHPSPKSLAPKQYDLKIAIRMNAFNVHINRAPAEGEVISIIQKPGKHSNVFLGNVEEKNEQQLISVKGKENVYHVLQLTGAFARRIESWVKKGEKVLQGDKMGIIRFGSQTNLYIQSDKIKINPAIKVGDKVNAGLTVVAEVSE